MNGIRNLIVYITAIALVALAAPGYGASPTKQWSIAVSPSQVAFGSFKVTLTLKNETPNGNSTINSLTVNLPAGYTIDTTKPTPVQTTWIAQTSYVAGPSGSASVSLSNMSPLKPQGSFTLDVWVNVTSAVACGQSALWQSGTAWTGSSFTGNTFLLIASTVPGASNTTTVPASSSLAFSTLPSNVEVSTDGHPHPVTFAIQATSCGTGTPGVQVNVTVTDGLGNVVASTSGTTGGNGTISFSLPITTTGTFTITARADSYTDITATFAVFGGLLNCEPAPPFNFGSDNGVTDPQAEGYAAGSRGFWNKDGMSCNPLLYTFTNTILTDDTVHLAWDTTDGQHPAFTYTMTWRNEDVDNPANLKTLGPTNYGWPIPKRVSVAWTLNGSGTPAFVPALACIDTTLPAPYATLHSGIDAATPTIIVDMPPPVPTYTDPNDNTSKSYPTATVPGSLPFSVVIGTERMLVTAISGNSWTVTRGYGQTAKAAHATSGSTVYVMSTPLPIDLNTGIQVPMCVVNHGWMAAGFNAVTGVAQIRYFTTVFDIGDGWVLGR